MVLVTKMGKHGKYVKHYRDEWEKIPAFKNMNEVNFEADDDEDDIEVIAVDDNRYTTSLHVSKHYIGSIIGKKGAMKSRIEHDTKTEIKIPKPGQTWDIKIFGPNESNVKAAKRRIDIIVKSSRMKQRPTHFISIPMCNSEIMKNYEIFKENVLRDCTSRGLEESLFIHPKKLHITLGVMCLMDDEERMRASTLLAEAKKKIIDPMLQNRPPIRIHLQGLSYMNDEPGEVHVLYGVVHEENAPSDGGTLQELADSLQQFFYRAGFMNDSVYDRENVKLHVTFMNSRYRSLSSTDLGTGSVEARPDGEMYRRAGGTGRRTAFDATQILKKYSDFDFGVAELNSLHLSQMHRTVDDAYYEATCVIYLYDKHKNIINCE